MEWRRPARRRDPGQHSTHKRPEWDSYGQPKNWLEVKAGRHIVIDGNLMTSGTPTNIAITVRNQNGSSPWIEINDLSLHQQPSCELQIARLRTVAHRTTRK